MSYPLQSDVTSSNIAKAGHDGENLYLLFNSGVAYKYPNVPQKTYTDLISAESVGRFFYKTIRNTFRYEKLEVHQF